MLDDDVFDSVVVKKTQVKRGSKPEGTRCSGQSLLFGAYPTYLELVNCMLLVCVFENEVT
jgi:hypothetical protein